MGEAIPLENESGKDEGKEKRERNRKGNVEEGDCAVFVRVLKKIWKRNEQRVLKRRE